MQITIHRGAHTIGGSCVECSNGDQRIIFDIGSALMEKGGGEIDHLKQENPSVANGMLPKVQGLYKDDTPKVMAVFISHAHMDHYGLLDHVHPDIPVYLSKGSNALIETGKIFFPDKSKIFFDHFRTFEHWQPFTIGSFTITSHLMDHSGFDASSFLIEAGGKRVFYSGDFRGHGRKAKLLENFTKHPVKDIDCLLLEGTTLGGKHQVDYASEGEVEQGFIDAFAKQKDISFVTAAGSNVDRLVSLYRATKRTNKTLVLDLYSYYVLHKLHNLTKGSRLPPHRNDHIRIYYIKNHCKSIVEHLGIEVLYKFKARKIESAEIVNNRCNIVAKLPLSSMRRISKELSKEKKLWDAQYIYSMWKGYLRKDKTHEDFCAEFGIPLHHIHVSGHAYLDDLKGLAQAINPKQLIPIHTLSGDLFNKYFDNVVRVDDGVSFLI